MTHPMKIKGLTDEDFINYKVPSMFIATSQCSFKCDRECGRKICQNGILANQKSINVDAERICRRYIVNRITKAIVFGGLEPLDQFDDIMFIINYLRSNSCDDDVVIYTGYNRDEIDEQINQLRRFRNIVVKYGRFIPDQEPHFDEVLGVYLASDNQYAERLS